MSLTNQEEWYFLHRSTVPVSLYEVEDLLQTMTIYTRNKHHEVTAFGSSWIPVPTLNYVLLVATQLLVQKAGTYQLVVSSTSATSITLYVRNDTTSAITTNTFTGGSQTINIPLNSGTKYTIAFVQQNSNTNQTVFIRSSFNGTYTPKHQAYTGGNGVTMKLSSSSAVSVGDLKWSARTGDFDGWLVCDGRSVYRDAYPSLFAVIGTSFGAGNGTTTFNIPDCRGRVPGMVGTGNGLTVRNLGQTTGAETHVLNANELPGHTHTGTTATVAGHNHGGSTASGGTHTHTINDPGHTHTITTTNDDFNSSGGNPPGFAGDSAGTHVWSIMSTNTTGISIVSGGNHSHTLTIDGAHNHTFTTDSSGGGLAHNNMQPTLFIGNMFICAEV